ncbi:response regulator [Crocinitomix algicola]|uniref:response regulator n=1 Tax=Crocinitomix algicola TaxID=1740263 RepID=UPI000872F04D|nr:response regulator transcription factor [Crocinitomix algicola]
MIHVGIVEDNTKLAIDLKEKIELSADFTVNFLAKNGKDAVSQFSAQNQLDLILMDIEMPIMNGIEACREILNLKPNFPIIICSIYDDENSIMEAIFAGASGYLLKDESPLSIHEAIHNAIQGGSPLNPAIARKTLKLLARQAPTKNLQTNFGLTEREFEILKILASGKTYNQIAEQLYISPGTIRKHIENLYRKLGVNNKIDAINKLTN